MEKGNKQSSSENTQSSSSKVHQQYKCKYCNMDERMKRRMDKCIAEWENEQNELKDKKNLETKKK